MATPIASLTYAELDARSSELAGVLLRCGVVKGTRVGVLFPNGIEWVVTWAAAARLGAAVVPVNTFSTPVELARFLRHSDVQVLAGVPTFLRHDYVAALETAAPELAHSAPPHLLPSLPQLRHVLFADAAAAAWAEPITEGDPYRLDVVAVMGEDVTPGDVLLVTYTSGSTGDPKGVVHSHGSLIRHARNLAAMWDLDETTRIWTPMPLCWVGGFVYGLLRALTVGGCFVTQAVFEAGSALTLLQSAQVTDVAAWPGVTGAIAAHPDFGAADLSAVRTGLYEALPADARPADRGLAVGSLGMSETAGPHTFKSLDHERRGTTENRRGTFGRPVPGVEHRIVDPHTGLDVEPGQEGEVLVRGYSLMLGFYRRERSEVFDSDGWYHTGDRGLFRDGWFFFTGRQSDLIKTGGSNVAPAEVEGCLAADAAVAQAFVLGMPDAVRGQRVVAVVVRVSEAADPTAVEQAVRARAKAELSSYKVPEQVLVLDASEVPWMSSQKVDRRGIRAIAERRLIREG